MTDSILQLSRIADVGIAIDQSAFDMRTSALELAACVEQVTSETEQFLCVGAMTEIKRLLKLVESSRTAVKSPVLKLGKDIDAKASEFTAELLAQEKRLVSMVSAFQAEQRRIAEEAEKKRIEELRRIEAERLEVEQEARRKAEGEMAKARNEQQRAAAAERARIEAERIAKANAEKVAAAAQVPVVAPIRTAGQVVRSVKKFEVIDAAKVFAARPDLCRIEVSASAVNRCMADGLTECPGLRIWEETQVGVRV